MAATSGCAPLRLVHVGLHERRNANAGDTLLFQALRDLIERVHGPVEWTLRQLWEPLEPAEAGELARYHDGMVVGGGGLLLRDQQGSDTTRSGWQWNVDAATIAGLPLPLAVMGIGYNRFRGQEDFDPQFTQNVRSLVSSAAYVGLRNSGSIRSLAAYLEPGQDERLSRYPCPTTALRQLYAIEPRDAGRASVIGLSVAFDRSHLRFGATEGAILDRISLGCRGLQDAGIHVRLLLHKAMDANIRPSLDAAGVEYSIASLADASPAEIIDAYRPLDAVVGMRGHSQLIPFGLGTPIVSLISHNKLAWFLEDLGRPGWGIEVHEAGLTDRLIAAVREAVTPQRRRDVVELQGRTWTSLQNATRQAIRALEGAQMAGAV